MWSFSPASRMRRHVSMATTNEYTHTHTHTHTHTQRQVLVQTRFLQLVTVIHSWPRSRSTEMLVNESMKRAAWSRGVAAAWRLPSQSCSRGGRIIACCKVQVNHRQYHALPSFGVETGGPQEPVYLAVTRLEDDDEAAPNKSVDTARHSFGLSH